MQTVQHTSKNIHPLFTEFESLYALTSTKQQGSNSLILPAFSNVFMPLLQLFKEYGNVGYHVKLRLLESDTLDVPKVGKTIIICTSGGKDSLATILYYRKKKYKVILYHLKGINQTYKDEWKAVEQLAQLLGLQVVFEEVKLSGSHEWIEHPMKNMILANMALQYGIRNRLTTKIAFGNFSTSTLSNDPFDVCGGDCKEMWKVYVDIIRNIIPDFQIYTPLSNFQDTIDTMLENPKLLQYTQSCIGPYRYRNYLHANNEKKFGIKLPQNNCGSCWKCCLEYCVFCDNGVYEYNEEYYRHCLEILRKTLYKESGIKYNINDTWNHYFFYGKEKSQFFQKIA